jgi:hypothetical protein
MLSTPYDLQLPKPSSLTPPCGVPRVHGHEDAHGHDEADLLPQELEARLAVFDGLHHDGDLARHHGQHLHLDAVELVQARPRARLRQPM